MSAVVSGFIFGLIGMLVVPKEISMFGAIGGILVGGIIDYLLVDVLSKFLKKLVR